MPVYPCPECGAQLRPANPVPAGKKLRCPNCDTVFAPTRAAAKPAKPAPAKPARPADDEEEVGRYGLVEHKEDEGAASMRDAIFAPIKDRFARSARGPALVHVVKPSTWLLATGVSICIFAVVGALWAIWPLVFKVEDVQPPDKSKPGISQNQEKRRFKELPADEWNQRWWFLGGFAFQFVWGAVVCAGASKMHMLEAYPLAVIGSVMAMAGPGVPAGVYMICTNLDEPYYMFIGVLLAALPGVPMSLWCLATLRRQDVRDGFAEDRPED